MCVCEREREREREREYACELARVRTCMSAFTFPRRRITNTVFIQYSKVVAVSGINCSVEINSPQAGARASKKPRRGYCRLSRIVL